MERELLSMDYDILQAIASSEGLSGISGSKNELVRRIIEHRKPEEFQQLVDRSPLHSEDILYVRHILTLKGFNPELLMNITSKVSLIMMYEAFTEFEKEPLRELRALYNDLREDIPFRSQWGHFLSGDISAMDKQTLLDKLRMFMPRRVAHMESVERYKEKGGLELREALATLPDYPHAPKLPPDGGVRVRRARQIRRVAAEAERAAAIPVNMRDGAPSQLGVPRVVSPGGGSGMAHSPRGRPIIGSPGGGAGMAPVNNKQHIIAALLGMGIDLPLAKKAAKRGSSIEAALEWILAQ